MNYRQYIPLAIFIPVLVIQLTIITMISIEQIGPDLIVILLVYFTLLYGQLYGTVIGFVFGFIFDLASGGLLGAAMFSKTLTGFVAGYFYNENKIEQNTSTLTFLMILFLCAVLDSFAYSLLAYSGPGMNPVFLIFELSILPGAYTAVLAFPFIIFNLKKVIP